MKDTAWLAIPLGALIAVGAFIWANQAGYGSTVAWAAAVALLCAIWWVFEPIPIAVTALVPLAVLPLVGVLSPSQVAQAYGNPLILLLLGGFMLSKAMERSGAHRRLALQLVAQFGGSDQRRLVLGFMAASALLSMWISNTATTLMLLPVALAVVADVEEPELARALLLGIAYAASIGGVGTPIGTPPNLVFMQVYGQQVGATPGFVEWMSWGVPIVIVVLPLAGLWLTRGLGGLPAPALQAVGPWRVGEIRTLLVFGLTGLLWVTRQEPFGGWSSWAGLPQANDASVALLAVLAMFLIPDGRGERLLDWDAASSIPWGILILFGGGIAIAQAFSESGLSQILGAQLAVVGNWPIWVAVIVVCLSVTFLTELTSNTATTVLLMPILAIAGQAAGIDPRLLMVPAAISASCAFMLPVATAPNAIVYGTGRITTRQMAQQGLVLNFLAAGCISLICVTILA